MANGKEVAAFEFGATSLTINPLPGGGRQIQMNMEGTVTGAWNAAVLSTMNVSTSDLKNGTYTETVLGFLADGTTISADGGGVTEALGGNKWRVRGSGITSDGHAVTTEGEMELATRSYKGKIYE